MAAEPKNNQTIISKSYGKKDNIQEAVPQKKE
jgi:hypothetical protein